MVCTEKIQVNAENKKDDIIRAYGYKMIRNRSEFYKHSSILKPCLFLCYFHFLFLGKFLKSFSLPLFLSFDQSLLMTFSVFSSMNSHKEQT